MEYKKYAQVEEDFDKIFATRNWASATRQAFLTFVFHQLDRIAVAFGGCINCYGKGFATIRETASGYDEYTGQEYNQTLPPIKFCTCDRGMQLKVYFGKKT